MRKKDNRISLLSWLVILLVPIQILAYVREPIVSQNIVYFMYIIIVIFGLLKAKKFSVNKNMKKMYLGVLLSFFLFPLILGHLYSLNSYLYVFLLIIFIFNIDVIGQQLFQNKEKIIKYWIILGTIFVDYFIIKNINEFNIHLITNPFGSAATRYRAFFGFVHPNTVAMCIDFLIILYYFSFRYIKNGKNGLKKFILIILTIFNFLSLLCTNSRTAIFCLIIFIIFDMIIGLIKNIKSEKLKFLIMFVVFVGAFGFLISLNYKEIAMQTSGRYETILKNITNLDSSNSMLFGTMVTNISNSNKNLASLGLTGSDNWYYMQIVRFGIIGLLAFMIPLFGIIKKLYKSHSCKETSFTIALVLYLMIYGLGENVLYNQATIITLLVWGFVSYSLLDIGEEVQE